MTTAVAIVNWNSGRWLLACIESVLATAPNVDIVVVDNASEDESVEMALGVRNRVDFILNRTNRGLAPAMNQAFAATSAAYVLMLNPDVRATAGAVACLQDFMDVHPRAGAVGGFVNAKYWPRRLPGVGNLILQNLGIAPKHSRQTVRPGDPRETFAVEQPAAAALLIRREAYEEIGGFDEQFYPAWYEDVDFCCRLKAARWETYFAPQAEFLHEGGYSAKALGADAFAQAYYRNQLRYAKKHFGTRGALAVRSSIVLGMLGRMTARPRDARAHWKAILGALGRW